MRPLLLALLTALSLSAAELHLKPGEVIAFIGNNTADRMQHDGWIETKIQLQHPQHKLVFRNLGFTGDTIDKRPRSSNFGSPEHWLDDVKANVVFAFFGYNEAFAGEGGLKGWRGQLETLIGQTQGLGRRIVLISPIAHEDLRSPHLPDGSENNTNLAAYTAAMAEVAKEKGVPFVDLFTPTKDRYADAASPLTINGIHLTSEGNEFIADVIVETLFPGDWATPPADRVAKTREAVIDKNYHWFSRYRVVDGYNVYGGRSRLNWHGQSNADVMSVEMQMFDQMAKNRDARIHALATGKDLVVKDDNLAPNEAVKTNRPGKLEGGAYPYNSGKDAIDHMTIHEGLEVNLFASEEMFPDLINPVQMAVDPDGRLFAVTWPSYPHWHPKQPRNDRIVMLPDDNGDGVADRMVTFAGELNSVTGIEFWGGGMLVAAAPEIWWLKDSDGDGVADIKKRVFQGVSSADTHHTANGLSIGPDGGLYWSRGVFHVTNAETPTKTFRSTSSGMYRFDPRTYEIGFHFPIGPNPHGNAFDRWGFQFATDGTSGTGYYVAIGKGQRAPKQFYQKQARPVPASGVLSSSHFPPEFEGNFLICNSIGFLGILNYEFEHNGADVTAKRVGDILVSKDGNFRPTDIEIGGDGALYVSDWQNALIGHMQHNMRDPNRDAKHGRVYRVTAKDRPLVAHPKLIGKPIPEVLAAFKRPENGVRYRARLELSGRDTAAVTAAVAKFAKNLNPGNAVDAQALLECLWTHEEHRAPNLELAAKTFKATEPKVRAAVARTVGHWGMKAPAGVKILQQAAADEAIVRAEAAVGAVNFEGIEAAEVIFEVGSRPTDPQLDYVLGYAKKSINVDQILAEARKSGTPLSASAKSYVLASASVGELLKMEPSEGVHRQLLERPGTPAENRLVALRAIGPKPTPKAVADRIKGDLAAEFAALLPLLSKSELGSIKPQLANFATHEDAGVRGEVTAARVKAGEPAAKLLEEASKDGGILTSFLTAVPNFDEATRSSLYDGLRALALTPPKHLQSASGGNGLRYHYYRPHFNSAKLEVVDKRKATKSGRTKTLDYKIDGHALDGMGYKFEGFIQAPVSGSYTFGLSSDDGSCLYIDGKLIINHDGNHSASRKEGKVTLASGAHRIIVTYFDSGGGDALSLDWTPPGGKKAVVPAKAFAGGGGGIQALAAKALTSILGKDAAIFADMVALLTAGKGGDVPLAYLRTDRNRPQTQIEPLAKALTNAIPATPIALRDGDAFKANVVFAKDVANSAKPETKAALLAAVSDLDLLVIRVNALVEQMKYDRPVFTVQAGKPVKIIFSNPDHLPHNLVITKPGKMETVTKLAESMSPDFQSHSYVPLTEDILHASKLIDHGKTTTLAFTAPTKPGDYPVVCTFPGHWLLMRGTMVVE